jgi:hypothetical protein
MDHRLGVGMALNRKEFLCRTRLRSSHHFYDDKVEPRFRKRRDNEKRS